MNVRSHIASHWHHYSIGGVLFWLCTQMSTVWEKTEWLRAMVGWAEKKGRKKKGKRRWPR